MADELKPTDFPVHVEDTKLVSAKGKVLAETKTEQIACEISDRLNEQQEREDEDRWSA